jgi:hypothetical protein
MRPVSAGSAPGSAHVPAFSSCPSVINELQGYSFIISLYIHVFRDRRVGVFPLLRRKYTDSERGALVAASGAVAGALSRTMTAPFDRIRIVSAGTGVSIGSALRTVRKEGAAQPMAFLFSPTSGARQSLP